MALQEELEVQGNFLFKHRGTLPIIILIVGLIVCGYDAYYKVNSCNTQCLVPNTNEYIFLGIAILGLVLRAYVVGCAAPNTSGRNTLEGQVADTVNDTGMYSIVRHPLYVGNYLMWLGLALITHNYWFVVAFTLTYWLYYERIMFAEEQFLRKKFGQAYVNWSLKTPAFIPNFSQWKTNKLEFQPKKAIRQEKTGLFLTALCFLIFKEVQCYVSTGDILPINSFWVVFFVISLVLYVLIKMLQKASIL